MPFFDGRADSTDQIPDDVGPAIESDTLLFRTEDQDRDRENSLIKLPQQCPTESSSDTHWSTLGLQCLKSAVIFGGIVVGIVFLGFAIVNAVYDRLHYFNIFWIASGIYIVLFVIAIILRYLCDSFNVWICPEAGQCLIQRTGERSSRHENTQIGNTSSNVRTVDDSTFRERVRRSLEDDAEERSDFRQDQQIATGRGFSAQETEEETSENSHQNQNRREDQDEANNRRLNNELDDQLNSNNNEESEDDWFNRQVRRSQVNIPQIVRQVRLNAPSACNLEPQQQPQSSSCNLKPQQQPQCSACNLKPQQQRRQQQQNQCSPCKPDVQIERLYSPEQAKAKQNIHRPCSQSSKLPTCPARTYYSACTPKGPKLRRLPPKLESSAPTTSSYRRRQPTSDIH